ncbi:YccF domain-containing protein [Kitasatospora sp. NPDC052896]|uniref:YccF domain-containing protein n=1 Tax=Kitasatospora sp. NPDC052896 TaxID=3364061 RepID=UPI0037C84BC5
MKAINVALNILWLVLCGFWMAVGYIIAGVICCILVITIPFGIASFRIASFMLWPFGRTTVERPDAGAASCAGNVIWILFAGWWLALAHIATSIALFVTIVGIPFAWANLKLVPVSLMPLGREIVSTDRRFAGW